MGITLEEANTAILRPNPEVSDRERAELFIFVQVVYHTHRTAMCTEHDVDIEILVWGQGLNEGGKLGQLNCFASWGAELVVKVLQVAKRKAEQDGTAGKPQGVLI